MRALVLCLLCLLCALSTVSALIACGEGFCPDKAAICCPNQGGCCLENELCTDEMPPRCIPKPAVNITLCADMPCDSYNEAAAKREEIRAREESKQLALRAKIQARENWRAERRGKVSDIINSLSEIGARNDQFKDSLPIDDYNNLKGAVENLKPEPPKPKKSDKSLKERLAAALKEADAEAEMQLEDNQEQVSSGSSNGTGVAVFSSPKRRQAAVRRVKRMLRVLTSGEGPTTDDQKRAVEFLREELRVLQTGQGNIRIRAAELVAKF